MLKTRILTTSEVNTKRFVSTTGQANVVFSDAMQLSDGKIVAGPKNFMIKTADLDEFVEFVIATRDAWRKAKAVEAETNNLGAKT